MHENRHILDESKAELWQLTREMSRMTVSSLGRSVGCIKGCKQEEAQDIIDHDNVVNEAFSKIERVGFYLIASQQPVAHDLREIIAAMRIASELERIADHASSIASIRLEIECEDMDATCGADITGLGEDVQSMFDIAVDAFDKLDVDDARKLETLEQQVDEATERLTAEIFECLKQNTDLTEDLSRILWIVHTLERIADRSTNIAEHVIYAVTAEEEKIN